MELPSIGGGGVAVGRDDAIELLQREDISLTALFDELEESTGQSVIDRSSHGDQSKRLIRRLAVREAAKADIARILDSIPELDLVRAQIEGDAERRRSAINDLDLMARGVRGIELNRTQDFDAAIRKVREIVAQEIYWELSDGIPSLRRSLSDAQRTSLRTAGYLRRHAPTRLDPRGSRWYERARLVSWLITVWDHLLDRPRPRRGAQAQ
jgi:hypothetical protein